jgi:hemerythrin superfamily protein
MDKNFEVIYQRVRSLYDEVISEGDVTPMEVFGVFLGVIAQEFRTNSTQEKFQEFLEVMRDHPWPEETMQ